MVLLKNWPFFQIFSSGNIREENVFYDILERKTPFKAIETKSGKIAIFPKGLVHGFGQKLAIFPNFFLRQYSTGK